MDLEAVTRTLQVEDMAFPVVDYGHGSAVLLLHGFPDSRHLWRHQIPALADAGLRVIAPDLRGFGDAPKPASVEAYQVSVVAQDVNVKPESPTSQHSDFPTINCPVLGIWSDGDHYLTEEHLRSSHEKIEGLWRYERIEGASHWMMLDKPEELNRLLIEFLVEPTDC